MSRFVSKSSYVNVVAKHAVHVLVLLVYVKIVDTEKNRISEYIRYTYTLTTYLFWVGGFFIILAG